MLKEYNIKSFGDDFDVIPALWIDLINIIDANYSLAAKEKGKAQG